MNDVDCWGGQMVSSSIQIQFNMLQHGWKGGGVGGKRFNVAVQQNRTDVEENVDRAFRLPI